MGASLNKQLKKIVKERGQEAAQRAHIYASSKVQNDFDEELIGELAKITGHEHLAATCYVDIELNADGSLSTEMYNDYSVLDPDVFKSKSSFHQSGAPWVSVSRHYDLHRDAFWEEHNARQENGIKSPQYGSLDLDWVTDNFWDGIVWKTNGWPLGNADFLSAWSERETPAVKLIELYIRKYNRSRRYWQYIQEGLGI